MDTAMIEKFVDLETGVWEALVNGDGQADAALLSADFSVSMKPAFQTEPNTPPCWITDPSC